MRIVVHKYGGSSVADLDKIRAVAERIERARADGTAVVAVVSAMGNTTNELFGLANQLASKPDRRELDMLVSVGERISVALLAIALKERGVPARSLTGSQSGIITDEAHADARVVEVRPDRIRAHLEQGEVVLVAGFQGVSRAREVTTLGRGGSDTTAVVLAAALNADHCEICSDVDGVWSADPRLVPDARRIDAMPLDEGLALARGGAKVLFEDALQYARDHGVVIHAVSTFGPGAGTRLVAGEAARAAVSAVTGDDQLGRVRITGDVAAVAAALKKAGARVRHRVGDVVLVDLRNAHGALGDLPGGAVDGPTATVTVAGSGLGARLDLIARGEAAMAEAGVAWRLCGAAGDAAWWEVAPAQVAAATRALHAALIA